MTAKEMKIKTFSLIEEYYPDEELLATDDDVKYKINGVINQIMLDLMKYRKIPAKYSYTIKDTSSTLVLSNIEDLYQLNMIPDVDYTIIGDYEVVFDVCEKDLPKTIDVYYYRFPELMDLEFEAEGNKTATEVAEEYDEDFEFELDPDLLEIMPYGIAADLLKTDMINAYGKYFYERYLELKNLIDSRTSAGTIRVTGGVEI